MTTAGGPIPTSPVTMDVQSQPSNSIPRLWATFGVVPAIALFSAALFSWRVIGADIALIALGIIWISVLPSLIYLAFDKTSTIPFFPCIGLFYAVYFGLPVFTIPLSWADPNMILIFDRVRLGPIQAAVLWNCLGGVTAMIVAFYFFRHVAFRKLPPFRLPAVRAETNLKPLLWLLTIVHFMPSVLPGVTAIPTLNQFFGPAFYLSAGGLYFYWCRDTLTRAEKVLFIAVVCAELYLRVELLFITSIVLFFLFIIFLLWRAGRFRFVAILAGAAALIVPLYASSTVFRSAAPPGVERVSIVISKFAKFVRDGQQATTDGRINSRFFKSVVDRTGQLWVFHHVYMASPEQVPYWMGETYKPLLSSMIPRVLYPDKPAEITGGEFGRRYGMMLPDQYETSFNLPWITELLANFGPSGVLVGMAFFGMFFAFLDKWFNARGMRDIDFAVGLTLIFPLVYPESNFSLMTGSMLPLLGALVLYFAAGNWILSRFAARRS